MPSLVPAAQQLIQQVQNINPKAAVKSVGEQDGFGRLRSIQFDARTSRWLVPALEAIDDPRIASVSTDTRRAVVTFVGDTRADHRDPYPLDVVLRVLQDDK